MGNIHDTPTEGCWGKPPEIKVRDGALVCPKCDVKMKGPGGFYTNDTWDCPKCGKHLET